MNTLADAGLADITRVVYTSDHEDNLGARGLWGKSTIFEKTAGVPLIISGAAVASGKVIETPVSHVDMYPFILDVVGEQEQRLRKGFHGTSLFDLANGVKPSEDTGRRH